MQSEMIHRDILEHIQSIRYKAKFTTIYTFLTEQFWTLQHACSSLNNNTKLPNKMTIVKLQKNRQPYNTVEKQLQKVQSFLFQKKLVLKTLIITPYSL